MSTLRSSLEELRAEDLRFAGDDALVGDLAELERASGALEVERGRRIAEIERRQVHRLDGHLSVASWLTARFRLAWSTAVRQVRQARALEAMPLAREALAEGDLSRSAVDVLVAARESNVEAFGRDEGSLVEAARTMPYAELRRVAAYWREAVEPARFEREHEHRNAMRRLYVSPMLDGMVRVDGDLDPETGQTLITALRSVQDAETRRGPDVRSAAQRRADALGEICRRWLDGSNRPVVAGERPHVTVTVDLESLERRAGRRCELEDAGPIPAEAARRLACDASVARVITSGRSEPLDVGRRTPVVPSALRRAVVVRDGRCRFPSCDRPQAWCDAHHVVHWADGGSTSLDNLVLLCRPHHRAVHNGFRVEMVDGRPVFRRPDGSPLEDRAPPQVFR